MVLCQHGDQVVQVEGRLRDEAAAGRDVGRIQGGEPAVPAEDPEHADALMGAQRRPLAIDELLGTRDGRREADAVLGALDVVIHRLRDGDERHAMVGERLREAQRVITTDGHQVVDAQPLDVLEHDGRQVPGLAILGHRVQARLRDVVGQRRLRHLPGVRARGMEHRAAGPVDGPGVHAIEGHDIARVGDRPGDLVRQPFPAPADAHDLVAEVGRAIGDALDDAVEAGDVPASGQDADASGAGHGGPLRVGWYRGRRGACREAS